MVETVHPDVDGVVFSNAVVNDDGTEMSVGDNASDVTLQSLVSFPLALPEGAAVRRAVVRLYGATSFEPPNPHLTDPVLVEHLRISGRSTAPTSRRRRLGSPPAGSSPRSSWGGTSST